MCVDGGRRGDVCGWELVEEGVWVGVGGGGRWMGVGGGGSVSVCVGKEDSNVWITNEQADLVLYPVVHVYVYHADWPFGKRGVINHLYTSSGTYC